MATAASQVIARELDPDESLLWSGQPRKGIVFRSSDVMLIPFSLAWGGFAIFWEATALSQAHKHRGGSSLFLSLWGIPFVLVGLYLIFGRFLVDSLQREKTYYGITDRRVVIVTPQLGARRKVKSLDLRTLNGLSITERPNGSGTITFGPENQYSSFAGAGWPGASNRAPSFDSIDHVKSVYDQIRRAQQNAS